MNPSKLLKNIPGLDTITYGYSLARGALYLSEMAFFRTFTQLLVGQKAKFDPPRELVNEVRQSLFQLLREDTAHIKNGVYPITVLSPESLISHLKRLPSVFLDGLSIQQRRNAGKTQVFNPEAKQESKTKPKYFQRNFHFQTDGYFSEKSAEIYDHQVEMLFTGAADAMRRMIIPVLKSHFKTEDGEGLKFLEIGAGTGRASQFIHLAFPKAELTVSDMSESYLNFSKKHLNQHKNINFIRAAGEDLPFKEGTFDAVISVFLFHELPLEVRKQVVTESLRVLNNGGILAAVDSIQNHDHPEFNLFLEQFPKEYHEPFYRNYCENPLENLFENDSTEKPRAKHSFFSKVVYTTKWEQKSK